MGKIRINTIGDEKIEKKQKESASKRKESKKSTKITEELTNETQKPEQKEAKVEKKQSKKSSSNSLVKERSKNYKTHAKLIDKEKIYPVSEAIELLEKVHIAKFDETVELHINTFEKGLNGTLTLPHGSGKKIRISIVSPATDAKNTDELLKKIESGIIDFDVLIATPDAMPRLAKVARVLGPRGLMPNPKNGTVTAKPDDLVKKYQSGQISFRTESKSPIMHLSIGKLSFGKDKLLENITAALTAIESKNIKNVTLKSTMSPGIKIQTN